MPYSLHHQDRDRLIATIADIIADIPNAELSTILTAAIERQQANRKDCSNCTQALLSEMRSAILGNSPRDAFSLFIHATKDNSDILFLYRNPRDSSEQALSEEIYQVLVELARALILAYPVPEDISDEMSADRLDECLQCLRLLGGNVPDDLIKLFGSILDRCKTESGETPRYISWRITAFELRHSY
jgi:hypothetical protein